MGYGSGLARYFPNLSYQCNPQVELLVAQQRDGAVMLDLGAGGRRLHPNMQTVDFVDGGDTDIVANVCDVPLPAGSVDLIIATGLIEHVEDDVVFIRECRRLLKTGGVVHIEVPFLYQYHEDPIDMRRFTLPGLEAFAKRYGFDVQKSGFHIGPSVTIATLNAYYINLLFDGNNVVSKVLANGAFFVMSVLGWPFKFLDVLLKNKTEAHRIASGVFVTGVRRAD